MARCYKPFFIKNGDGKQVLIPCGYCPKCKARRVSAWSKRLMEQVKKSTTAYFITLTYNDENLPITSNGYRSLRKRDLQLFFKRLRKAHEKSSTYQGYPIRYFAVGEYGGKIGRPHYHVILFNADREKIQNAWSYSKWSRKVIYRKRGLNKNGLSYAIRHEKSWHHSGFVHYGNQSGVNEASVGYTLKYILKPRDKAEYYIDAQPEFAVMSKGLGAGYLSEKMVRWHRADLEGRMYCNIEDGKKITMPRYYKDRLYTKEEREQIATAARTKFAEDILKDFEKLFKSDNDYVSSYQRRKRSEDQSSQAAYRKQSTLKTKKLQHAF